MSVTSVPKYDSLDSDQLVGIATDFKRTEVGLIPLEWSVRSLGSLTVLMTNGFVGTATSVYTESTSGILYIQGYNVKRNEFKLHGMKRVTRSFHAAHQKSCLREGDLLTIQTGDIGVTAVVPRSLVGSNCHALIISRLDASVAHPYFFCHLFNSDFGRVAFKEIETGSTMKHLNVGDMLHVLVPSPPLNEQKAIALALSDVDGMIGSLSKLIAKKRAIKKAAMQQLLTGKTRLPGFSGEWKPTAMRHIGSTYGGLSGKTKSDFGRGEALYVTFMNVLNNVAIKRNLFARVHTGADESQNSVRKGDLLYNGTSETPGDLAMGAVVCDDLDNLYLNSFCFGFRIHDPRLFHALFVAFYFRGPTGRNIMHALAQGATRYNMSKRQFLDLELSMPSHDEQIAIAAVLSDMDTELTALESRLAKTRQIKQGMMQQLLTGRVRLVRILPRDDDT